VIVAIPPLAAEQLFTVAGLPITNTMINSWLALGVFLVLGFLVRFVWLKNTTKLGAPKGALNFVEQLVEFILDYMDRVTGNRHRSIKFLPIIGSLFLFILTANWMGLLPGTGSIGIWEMHEGALELIPIFRPANTDLNMTLAMAVLSVLGSHVLGAIAIGFWKYLGRFIKIYPVWKALRNFNPTALLVAVIELFVGFIEIFSEVAKMVSLSLRLYGNIFAGEVLLTVIASLVSYFVPLPFMALEILVGVVQAAVFSMLTLVYLNLSTTESHGESEHKPAGGELEQAV
jgi:F-type H+-transporting ATPase subunit a